MNGIELLNKMNLKTLKKLIDIPKRNEFFREILEFIQSLNDLDYIYSEIHEVSEGKIPIIYIKKNIDFNKIKYVKLFVGAQHNEYNGLFGILEIFQQIKNNELSIKDLLNENQVLIFSPLMNPFGFLHPKMDNKSGYYLENGMNLNRFWRRTFIPEYISEEIEINESPIPDQALLLKKILEPFWEKEDIKIYIMDFHETSLLERFPRELSMNLSTFYKFDHWLTEAIIKNIIDLNNVKYHANPLFYKCNSSSNHSHLNLSIKQVDLIREKLFEYLVNNKGKLPFYFVYSRKSKEYCVELIDNLYIKLKDILWETTLPIHDHEFHDHGCLVKMNDDIQRDNVYCIELENQKQFFNIFEDIEQSINNEKYFFEKLEMINKTLILAKETIIEMIKLF